MILQTKLYFLLPNAQVKEGLAIRGSSVENSENEITQWLKDNGVI